MIRCSITAPVLVGLLATGCAITFHFQDGMDAGPDAGPSPVDAGPLSPEDAGPPPNDAGLDAGPVCVTEGAPCALGADAGTCRMDGGELICCTGCFVPGSGCQPGNFVTECGIAGDVCEMCTAPLSCRDNACRIADPAVQVLAGRDTSMALLESGRLMVWGGNPAMAYVATGSPPEEMPAAVLVPTDHDVAGVAVPRMGESSTTGGCYIDSRDDELYCWGQGVPGVPNSATEPVALPTLVARPAGVSGWRMVRLANVRFGVANGMGGCAMALDGAAWCWGEFRNCGLTLAGEPMTEDDTVLRPLGFNVRDMALSPSHGCFIEDNASSTLYCWGLREAGRLGRDPEEPPYCAPPRAVFTQARGVATGEQHSCGIRAGGQVVCWGQNRNLQAGPTRPEAWDLVDVNVREIFEWVGAAPAHTCALTSEGEAWCWGCGANKRLGGDASNEEGCFEPTAQNAPQQVDWPVPFDEVSIAQGHACGRDRTGAVVCWGAPSFGANHGGLGGQGSPVVIELDL